MKTWVKYGAAIMGLLIVSALIISFGMKKEESYRDIKVMSIKGTATVERASVGALDAYEDMDGQPVQGENITASKKEIEETIDTLNIAFEKLLDSIFRDTAWDVSTDISVLHTVLAQEGLTEDDFEKMKQNAEVK